MKKTNLILSFILGILLLSVSYFIGVNMSYSPPRGFLDYFLGTIMGVFIIAITVVMSVLVFGGAYRLIKYLDNK